MDRRNDQRRRGEIHKLEEKKSNDDFGDPEFLERHKKDIVKRLMEEVKEQLEYLEMNNLVPTRLYFNKIE